MYARPVADPSTRVHLPAEEQERYVAGMESLVEVVQQLSLARSLADVQRIVRSEVRPLTGADGATFILLDDGHCHYLDEDAIAPLWKGRRFPLDSCISGWSMIHRQPVAIEDIYADERIPHDVYRPTFVKSLAIVPIRTVDPVGAIGAYWAARHVPTAVDIRLLGALADTTAVAMENVRIYAELEDRVRARTAELTAANQSLREFVAVAAHDLRSPLTSIGGAASLLRNHDFTAEERAELLSIIERQTHHLDAIISDLATLSLYDAGQLAARPEPVPVADVAMLAAAETPSAVEIDVPADLVVYADRSHVQRMLSNFLRNAQKHGRPPVSLTARSLPDGRVEVRVVDAGSGVPDAFVPSLFVRFNRAPGAHSDGAGLGLSIAAVLADTNGGDVFYERAPKGGACFGVRLPAAQGR